MGSEVTIDCDLLVGSIEQLVSERDGYRLQLQGVKALAAEAEKSHALELEHAKAETKAARDRAELDAHYAAKVTAERDEAVERAKSEVARKAWVTDRIEAELRRAGLELQWTDGGGSACPGGWHRNPYLNVGNIGDLSRDLATWTARALAAEADAEALAGALRRIDRERLLAAELEVIESALANHKTGAALEAERERERVREQERWATATAFDEAFGTCVPLTSGQTLTPDDFRKSRAAFEERVREEERARVIDALNGDFSRIQPALGGIIKGRLASVRLEPTCASWLDCREAAAKAIDSAQPRSERARLARMIRALPPPSATAPTCARCNQPLKRGAIGGGHFDWLECSCTKETP
jgi:hypothetical protein